MVNLVRKRGGQFAPNLGGQFDRIFQLVKEVREITNKDYFSENNNETEIYWQKGQTDMVVLVLSLIKAGYINNKTNNITIKEAINYCSEKLGFKVNDIYGKLAFARDKKKENDTILYDLQDNFQQYLKSFSEN